VIWVHCLSDAFTKSGLQRRLALRVGDIEAYHELEDKGRVAVRMRSGREFVVLMPYEDFRAKISGAISG